jgi:hypothetical protein
MGHIGEGSGFNVSEVRLSPTLIPFFELMHARPSSRGRFGFENWDKSPQKKWDKGGNVSLEYPQFLTPKNNERPCFIG